MIPLDWQPCRRPSDSELTGYLASAEAQDLVVPMSVIGTPIGQPQPVDAATALVNQVGLTELAEFWWCVLPNPLPGNGIDVTDPQTDWTWRRVVIVEANPARCVIRPDLPAPDEFAFRVIIHTPVAQFLRKAEPEELSA